MASSIVESRPESQIQVVVFEDLQCSDCAIFRRMLDETLAPRYGPRVAFAYRDFPSANHDWARKAAIVSRYFSELDSKLALEYRCHMLACVKTADFHGRLAEFAREHSVDGPRAIAALADARLAALVERDYQDGVARGVAKTPTVFAGGRPFVETFTVEEISEAIDQALAKSA